LPTTSPIYDALAAAQKRGLLPTSLGTAELRELGAEVLARSVFTARGTSSIFVSMLKKVVEALSAGDIGDGQARTALYEILDALGYDVEKGGFPGEEVPPALRGTLQDLRSFRRMDLIVRTQRSLMQGAGEQWRGQQPDRLNEYPALMLIRFRDAIAPRQWPGRFRIAFQREPLPAFPENAYLTLGAQTGMIALKGDPGWGELGSYENFQDALGVDHAPFYFNSEMWTREVSMERCSALGVRGPDGQTPREWIESGEGITLSGVLPKVPKPRISLAGADPAVIRKFQQSTHATPVPGRDGMMDYSDLLAKEIAAHDEAYYGKGGRP